MKVLKKILEYKYFSFILLVIVIAFSLYRISNEKSMYNINETLFRLEVLSVKYKNNKYYVEFKGKDRLIGYYNNFSYDIGDIVLIKGKLKEFVKNNIPNSFDNFTYQKHRGIFYELEIKEDKLLKKNTNFINKLKKFIVNRINTYPYSEYLHAFLLGDTFYFNNEQKSIYQSNGLSYLLSIGSFTIYFYLSFFNKIKKKLKIKNSIFFIFISFFLIIYFLLTDMKIGIIRSGLTYLLQKNNTFSKIKIKKRNVILIVLSLMLLYNPSFLCNSGLYYSFVVSYGISLVHKYIKGNFFKRHVLIIIICFILSIPLNIYFNYEVNFLSLFLSLICGFTVSFLLFPISILSFIIPIFSPFLEYIITILEKINYSFSSITVFSIVFRKPSLFIVIVYYIIIYLSLKKKFFSILLFIVLFLHHNINHLLPEKFVTFLDVKEGDSIVVKNNSYVYLIDTGGNISYRYSKDIINYIKSFGIDRIKTIILTHGDYDHMGEAINLVENFKVEKVIFNCGEFNELEQDLIKVLEKKKISYYSCIKELNIDNNKLYFLQTKEYDNENDNSNVIYTEINGYKFIFMGDAGVDKENDILDKYNISDIDVIKVGHHGSKTSSGESFINEMNPKYSVISVGKNNRYGHPNKEVLDVLEDSKIYRTDQDGSIMFKIKNNKLKIETCEP